MMRKIEKNEDRGEEKRMTRKTPSINSKVTKQYSKGNKVREITNKELKLQFCKYIL